MKMIDFIGLVESTLGIPFENYFLLLMFILSIVFFAKDFRIGLMALFLLTGGTYLLFYKIGLDLSLVMFLLFFEVSLLSLSLYITYSRSRATVL